MSQNCLPHPTGLSALAEDLNHHSKGLRPKSPQFLPTFCYYKVDSPLFTLPASDVLNLQSKYFLHYKVSIFSLFFKIHFIEGLKEIKTDEGEGGGEEELQQTFNTC